jgi:alkanesulfonate monooxygenase SsuD/methylene tetrahydromethanopterin reductase-like flavin-dependent oxidoreductase (luciferase family)
VRLAGELADAWCPFLWSRSRIGEGRDLLRAGESKAGAAKTTRVSMGVPVALGPSEDDGRALAHWWLNTYATRMGPLYPRMLAERFGMAAGVAAVVEGDRAGGLPVEAEELAREVTLMGTYARAHEAVDEWFAAGADDVQFVLPPGRPEEELVEITEVAARVAAANGGVSPERTSSQPPCRQCCARETRATA